jgi:RHS repeat-associated protein
VSDRLTRIIDPAAPTVSVIAYSYNNNDRGNATSRTSATGFIPNTTSIVADEANRVRSMTTGGAQETFTYDGHGRRTRATTTSGTLMHFYTQAGQALFSENPATPSSLIKSRQYHIYLGNRRIAQKEMDALYYIHNDHLGSLLARTDSAGSLVEGASIWEPWGAPTGGGGILRGLRYAGHYTDFATGLSYMQQRYYDPYAGRFLAVDPVATSPASLNRYWYANNNPYKYVDPDGRFVFAIPLIPPAVAAIAKATAFVGTAALAAWVGSEAINSYNESAGDDANDPDYVDVEGNQPPFVGAPGSTVRGGTGSRTYGEDGYPARDRDLPHPDEKGCGSGDHCHDWGRPSDEGPPTSKDRGPPRPPRAGDPPEPRGPNVPPPDVSAKK